MKWKQFKQVIKKLEKDTGFSIVLPDDAKEQFKALSAEEREKLTDMIVMNVLLESVNDNEVEDEDNEGTEHYISDELLDSSDASDSVETVLHDRGTTYGDFAEGANLSQELKQLFYSHLSKNSKSTHPPKAVLEAIEMIIHKLSRIANGDVLYRENFRDIAGYAKLADDFLSTYEGATDAVVTKVKLVDGEWR